LLIWFSRHVDLYALLDQWADAGSNYEPRGVVDDSWYVDRYEIVLGAVGGGRMFDEAVRRLFRYDFYPQSFVRIAADFLRNDRPPQVGERVVQRVRVIPGVLDAVTMNIVSAVWEEPDRKGFTLVTSERQYETGEWTASILLSAIPGPAVCAWTAKARAQAGLDEFYEGGRQSLIRRPGIFWSLDRLAGTVSCVLATDRGVIL
jgi:uncharacterized protein (UPF0548 family)